VRHVAIRSRCLNTIAPYTTPGLGDRIHSAIIGWVYGQCTDEPATLHLTHDKWYGGQYGNKSDSWSEIVSLFPTGSLRVRHHEVLPHNEKGWLAYLRTTGIYAEMYSYGDYPGKFDTVAGFDIAPLLRQIPPLQAEPQPVKLPARFFTVQWDSSAKSRRIPRERRDSIIERYKRSTGCKPVVVGGEAEDQMRWSLKNIAYAMSRAQFHIGADSAFFHLAQLYMPWERIHLYNLPGGFHSHHALRARDNGAQINLHL
jgi:hypothetical protein